MAPPPSRARRRTRRAAKRRPPRAAVTVAAAAVATILRPTRRTVRQAAAARRVARAAAAVAVRRRPTRIKATRLQIIPQQPDVILSAKTQVYEKNKVGSDTRTSQFGDKRNKKRYKMNTNECGHLNSTSLRRRLPRVPLAG